MKPSEHRHDRFGTDSSKYEQALMTFHLAGQKPRQICVWNRYCVFDGAAKGAESRTTDDCHCWGKKIDRNQFLHLGQRGREEVIVNEMQIKPAMTLDDLERRFSV